MRIRGALLRTKLAAVFVALGCTLMCSSASACQGYPVASEQSVAIAKAWNAGTAPAIKQLRDQGVKVYVGSFNDSFSQVGIYGFPGYNGVLDMDVTGWLLIPEFQILLFFAAHTKLPVNIDFGETTTISIGKITYSVAAPNLSEEIVNYLSIRKADQYLKDLKSELVIIETYDRCPMYKFYEDDFCFSSKKISKIDTLKSIVLVKNLYTGEKSKRLQTVDIVDARILTQQREYGNPRRFIMFVDSMSEFLKKKATESVTIAVVQRWNENSSSTTEPFETIKMREKIWTGRVATSESDCYTP